MLSAELQPIMLEAGQAVPTQTMAGREELGEPAAAAVLLLLVQADWAEAGEEVFIPILGGQAALASSS